MLVKVASNIGLQNAVGVKATYNFHQVGVPTSCYIGLGYRKRYRCPKWNKLSGKIGTSSYINKTRQLRSSYMGGKTSEKVPSKK